MATIEDTFKLNDMVSPTLKNIERGYNAANMAANAASQSTAKFQQYITRAQQIYSGMERSAANWNTAQRQAAQETGYIKNAVDDLGNKAEKTGRQMKDSFNNAGNSTKVFRNNLLEIDAALNLIERGVNFLKQAVGQAINLSDTMTNTTSRLNMINDGLQTTAELQQKIFWSAQTTGAQYSAIADTVAKLGLQAGQAFGSNDEIIAFSELLNKNFIIAGTSATGIESTMYNLTQALSSGVLRGQDLNSVFSNAPNIVQSIADYMGVSIGQIREMAAEGEISANIVKNALFASADEINAKYEQMPTTFGQVFERIKNGALMNFKPVLQELNNIANDANFQEFTNMISNGIGYVASVALPLITWVKDVGIPGVVSGIDWLVQTIRNIGNFVQSNWNIIKPILIAIGVTYLTLIIAKQAIMFGMWVAMNLPIILIAAAIGALILIFIMFTEQIMGGLFWLGALFKNIGLWFANLGLAIWAGIQNIGAWFGNLAMGIWEVLKACAGNVKTAFVNTWLEVQIKFLAFQETVLSGVKAIIDKINSLGSVFGLSIDTTGINSSIDELAEKQRDLKDSKLDYTNIGEAWERGNSTFGYKDVGEAFNTFDVFEDGWGSEAYNAGAEVGAGLHDTIMGLIPDVSALDSLFNINPNIPDPEEYKYNNIFDDFNPTGGKLDEVGKIRDDVKITDEDIKLLKDVAQAEFVNKYTTMRPEFTMKIDTINENADMNYAISAFEEMIVESMSSNLST